MDRLNEYLSAHKLSLLFSLIGVVLIIGGIFASNIGFKRSPKKEIFPEKSLVSSVSDIKADISGAVKNPGVYILKSSDRVEDAIKAAGGFSDDANQEYISKYLNLSEKLSDGIKIYVFFASETPTNYKNTGNSQSKIISINSGSEQDLDSLPGIGSSTAKKIINSRPYSSIQDLSDKQVLSKSQFEKIRDLIGL